MKQNLAIYLAGTIKKGHVVSDLLCWTDEHMAQIQENLKDFDVSFLNPALRTDDLGDQFSVFGRDMLQVFTSHVVFVDARDRRGLGVGAEMMWAKMNGIPVVTWAPIYGTQVLFVDGEVVLKPVQDPEELDRRREEMGLEPLSKYLDDCREIYGLKR